MCMDRVCDGNGQGVSAVGMATMALSVLSPRFNWMHRGMPLAVAGGGLVSYSIGFIWLFPTSVCRVAQWPPLPLATLSRLSASGCGAYGSRCLHSSLDLLWWVAPQLLRLQRRQSQREWAASRWRSLAAPKRLHASTGHRPEDSEDQSAAETSTGGDGDVSCRAACPDVWLVRQCWKVLSLCQSQLL